MSRVKLTWPDTPTRERTCHDALHRGFQRRLTVGLESVPGGRRTCGFARQRGPLFKNKYGHVFTVERASSAKTIEWVHRVLKEERGLVIPSRPLEATAFQVENIRMAYVFYESGLSINVMYTVDDPRSGRWGSSSPTGWKSRQNWPRGSNLPSRSRGWPGPFGDRSSCSRASTDLGRCSSSPTCSYAAPKPG